MDVDPSPELTEACYQALLRHFWVARRNDYPRKPKLYPDGYLLSYGQLVEAANVPINPRRAGGPLYHVAVRCTLAGLPPINALVVNGTSGFPGEGFFAAPGSKATLADLASGYEIWLPIAESCIACESYEKPKIFDLGSAFLHT